MGNNSSCKGSNCVSESKKIESKVEDKILALYHMTKVRTIEDVLKQGKLYNSNTLAYKGILPEEFLGKIFSKEENRDYIGVYTRILPTDRVGEKNEFFTLFGNIILILDRTLLERKDFHFNLTDRFGKIGVKEIDFKKNKEKYVDMISKDSKYFKDNEVIFHNSVSLKDFLIEVRVDENYINVLSSRISQLEQIIKDRQNSMKDKKELGPFDNLLLQKNIHDMSILQNEYNDILKLIKKYGQDEKNITTDNIIFSIKSMLKKYGYNDIPVIRVKLDDITPDLTQQAINKSYFISKSDYIKKKILKFKPNYCYYSEGYIDDYQLHHDKTKNYSGLCNIDTFLIKSIIKEIPKNYAFNYIIKTKGGEDGILKMYIEYLTKKKLFHSEFKETDKEIKEQLVKREFPRKFLESEDIKKKYPSFYEKIKKIDYVGFKSIQQTDRNDDYDFGNNIDIFENLLNEIDKRVDESILTKLKYSILPFDIYEIPIKNGLDKRENLENKIKEIIDTIEWRKPFCTTEILKLADEKIKQLEEEKKFLDVIPKKYSSSSIKDRIIILEELVKNSTIDSITQIKIKNEILNLEKIKKLLPKIKNEVKKNYFKSTSGTKIRFKVLREEIFEKNKLYMENYNDYVYFMNKIMYQVTREIFSDFLIKNNYFKEVKIDKKIEILEEILEGIEDYGTLLENEIDLTENDIEEEIKEEIKAIKNLEENLPIIKSQIKNYIIQRVEPLDFDDIDKKFFFKYTEDLFIDDFEDYQSFIKNIINEVKEDIQKDKEKQIDLVKKDVPQPKIEEVKTYIINIPEYEDDDIKNYIVIVCNNLIDGLNKNPSMNEEQKQKLSKDAIAELEGYRDIDDDTDKFIDDLITQIKNL